MDTKPRVNEVLKDYEVTIDQLVPGTEYLTEHTYHGPGGYSSRSKGYFLGKDQLGTAYFSEPNVEYDPDDFVQVVQPDLHSRFYRMPSKELQQKSLERQAFAQSINKQTYEGDWRGKKSTSSVGKDLSKTYFGGGRKKRKSRHHKKNRKSRKSRSRKRTHNR